MARVRRLERRAGLGLPTWPREIYGYRFALIAAILGGARILYGSLEGLLEGKLGADLALAIACVAAILIGEPLVAAEVVFIGMVGECLEAFTFERTQRADSQDRRGLPAPLLAAARRPGSARLHDRAAGRRSRRRQAGRPGAGRWRRPRTADRRSMSAP